MQKMPKTHRLLASLIAASLATPLLAAPLLATQANQATAPLYQQHQQQQNQQLKALAQAPNQHWLNTHQYQPKAAPKALDDLTDHCLPFHQLEFIGVTLIDPKPFAPQKYECLSENRLNQLSRDLTSAYLAKGYIHTPFQFENDGSKVLRMNVKEGKVRKLSSESRRLNLAMLFPTLPNQPLRIQDLDQGLDQASRLLSSQVSVDVRPTSDGEIDLEFASEDRFPASGYFELKNDANPKYRHWQLKSNLNLDNLLSLSDRLQLFASSTLNAHRNFSRSLSLQHSIPYGYWTWHTFASYSGFHSQVVLPSQKAEQTGRTWQAGGKLDYVFSRSQNHISSTALQLAHSNAKNRFNQALLELQSPKLTSAQLELNHLQLFENASLSANFSYERGLKWWGALANQSQDAPQGQFNKWALDLQWAKYLPTARHLFRYVATLNGQYSRNYLPASKQGELLGQYAVRGFQQLGSSAEKQLILKQNLTLMKQIKQWRIEPYLNLDLGIQQDTSPQRNRTKAIGYGAGLTLSHKPWTLDLSWETGRLYQPQTKTSQTEKLFLAALRVDF